MSNTEVQTREDWAALPAPSGDAVADRFLPPPPDLSAHSADAPLLLPTDNVSVVATTDGSPAAPTDLPCPSIVESAPTITGIAELATIAPPDVDDPAAAAEPEAAPRPVDSPNQEPAMSTEAPSIPVLPAEVPPVAPPAENAAPAVPPNHQPSQVGMRPVGAAVTATPAATVGQAAPSPGGRTRLVSRTVLVAFLAAAVGAGAHLGVNWYEQRDAAEGGPVAVDGADLASWPEVGPPAIRYTDTTTTFRDQAGTRTVTAHREISSGDTQASVVTSDAAGVASTIQIDVRNEQSFLQPAPDAAWALSSRADATAALGDTWGAEVYSVRELFPLEAMPYISVLDSAQRPLPVGPLRPAVTPRNADPASPVVVPASPELTTMAWHYRVAVDVEAFRANETVAFQEWTRRVGRAALPRIEAWVDATGIVRRIAVEADDSVITHTLVGGTAYSSRFDSNPLLPAAPDAPVGPSSDAGVSQTAVPAPADTAVADEGDR